MIEFIRRMACRWTGRIYFAPGLRKSTGAVRCTATARREECWEHGCCGYGGCGLTE